MESGKTLITVSGTYSEAADGNFRPVGLEAELFRLNDHFCRLSHMQSPQAIGSDRFQVIKPEIPKSAFAATRVGGHCSAN
ncbi:hypothetical protein CDAR_369431 [Caerostris darwini]|uniref:Uncharacterized protein n=1 Tax=Caerostris darwini TaxID=1538125 RepID=A0AAV4RYJ4_9ARAC|nr:hypothetical protein CDAR_369431 [Caerostris darwini]